VASNYAGERGSGGDPGGRGLQAKDAQKEEGVAP